MEGAPPRRRASPSTLPDEIVEEILLRLPPDDPACLLRASLVCKAWSCAVSHPSFRRRLHQLHRTPPVLGFLHNWANKDIPRFISTTTSPFSLAVPDLSSWRALDCRHGRALFLSKGNYSRNLLVWDPITGAQQLIPVPGEFKSGCSNAAVVCAADGCDHRDCHGGPFLVVFLSVEQDTHDMCVMSACVHSSETGRWDELTSVQGDSGSYFTLYSSVFVGRSMLYFMSDDGRIQEYDMARHCLNVFDPPVSVKLFNLMLAEDGGLGVIQDFNPQLKLWAREKSDGTDARWVLSRVISLEKVLPNGAIVGGSVHVMGFAEGAYLIFVTTGSGLFTIELQSQRVRKVCNDHGFCNLIPVVSFYTPHSRLEALGKYKTMEDGNFANSSDCFNVTFEIRAPEVTDPSDNISKNAPNEESVKSTATASKDDPGSSEASGDEHGDSEEGYPVKDAFR